VPDIKGRILTQVYILIAKNAHVDSGKMWIVKRKKKFVKFSEIVI